MSANAVEHIFVLAQLYLRILVGLWLTHEMSFAEDVADHVIFMDGGVVVEEGKPDQIFYRPKEERTRQFLSRIMPVDSYVI